ncbi:MAG TPA: acylphosphatase [Rubricoccaceae bacterium]|nr:acylphosphatase [Rubricoccaceae bacterium]
MGKPALAEAPKAKAAPPKLARVKGASDKAVSADVRAAKAPPAKALKAAPVKAAPASAPKALPAPPETAPAQVPKAKPPEVVVSRPKAKAKVPPPPPALPAPDAVRVEAEISGRVQGVGFRYFARAEAKRFGLYGFVRNEPGGGVTVVAEGRREALERYLASLREGPPLAEVAEVDVTWEPATGRHTAFSIEY